MPNKQYKLRFLPLFEDDLNEIVDYIAIRLRNSVAANDMINGVQAAIRERLSCPEAFEPYPSTRERLHPYYRIYVKSYTIFYVVIDDVMEVRRMLYSKSNLPKKI